MIHTVDKDSLQRSIMIADSIISSKNVNTVLSNCLFNISRDSVEIVSTDNEIGIRTRLDGVADGEISLTANGKRFASILKELPMGEIVVDVNNSFQVNIKTRAKDIKARYTLVGHPRTIIDRSFFCGRERGGNKPERFERHAAKSDPRRGD